MSRTYRSKYRNMAAKNAKVGKAGPHKMKKRYPTEEEALNEEFQDMADAEAEFEEVMRDLYAGCDEFDEFFPGKKHLGLKR